MKRKVSFGSTWCAIVLVGGLCTGLHAAAQKQDSGQLSLTPEIGSTVLRIVTPSEAVRGGRTFTIRAIGGTTGHIRVAGTSIVAAGQRTGAKSWFGIDADGDGKLSRSEMKPVSSSGMGFQLKLSGSGRKYAIAVTRVTVTTEGSGRTITTGTYTTACCMKGAVNGQSIRLLDDNLDGKYTQDGKDAVALGSSLAAVPLMKVHQLGTDHYRLTVAEDGTSVSFERLADQELGVVKIPGSSAFKCLVMTSGPKAYDMKTSGPTGVPPGQYKLLYGMVGTSTRLVTLVPTQKSLTYDIQGGMLNTLRIGAPLRVDFSGSFTTGSKASVTVYPSVQILGAGNELYKPDYLGKMSTPTVALKAGEKVLASSNMEYG